MLSELVFLSWLATIGFSQNIVWTGLQFEQSKTDYLFWSGDAFNAAGEPVGTESFYKPYYNDVELHLSGTSILNNSSVLTTSVSYYSENRADAIIVPAALSSSINIDFSTNETSYWSLKLTNVFQVTSSNIDKPCIDDFLRQFHCGTAIPFVDSSQFSTKKRFNNGISIIKTWVF